MMIVTKITTILILNPFLVSCFTTTNVKLLQASWRSKAINKTTDSSFFSFKSKTVVKFSSSNSDTNNASETTSTPPLPKTNDPFLILGLSSPTSEKSQIKRAYKRRALQYHPDVRLTSSSTDEERKVANDEFAKINAAYAFLMGKSNDSQFSTASASTSSSSRNTSSYTPPHRRSAQSKPTSDSKWRTTSDTDFKNGFYNMPNYDKYDQEYDANGDSFSAIFSDFLSELVTPRQYSGSSSSSGILNDFISFLEGNFPSGVGFSSQSDTGFGNTNYDIDQYLNDLLRDGTIDDIKMELDDATLLARQLETKDTNLQSEYNEICQQIAAMKSSSPRPSSSSSSSKTVLERLQLEERKSELESRKRVVKQYLDNAITRRMKLKSRYEQLLSRYNYSSSSSSSSKNDGFYSNQSSYTSSTRSTTRDTSSYTTNTNPNINTNTNSDTSSASWKSESFGSSGRRSRGGRARTTATPTSSSSSNNVRDSPYTNTSNNSNVNSSSTSSSTFSNRPNSNSSTTPQTNKRPSNDTAIVTNLPPHRRLTSQYDQSVQDKKRLRELKVDDEMERMKKELGLS